jgi:ABC-type protease/lipase transport system fused ATPase/permease subunit
VVHRRSALALCDKVLVVLNGQQRDFGLRDEVLRRMSAPATAPAANLKVVGEPPMEERR